MDYCNDCDIAHEERICPLCVAQERIEELETSVEKLENEIAGLQNTED